MQEKKEEQKEQFNISMNLVKTLIPMQNLQNMLIETKEEIGLLSIIVKQLVKKTELQSVETDILLIDDIKKEKNLWMGFK